jgi:hypothetical protein
MIRSRQRPGCGRRTAPCTAARELLLRCFMKWPTYSIPIGIAVIALSGVFAMGCDDGGGLRSGKTDGGASDAAGSLGGQAGSTSSTGGTAGSPGAGGVTGSAATTGSGGANGGSSGVIDAGVDVSKPDASVDAAVDAGAKDVPASETRAAPDSSVAPDAKVVCGPVCDIYCANGNVLDATGCPTCSCKPPPDGGPACPCAPGTMQNAFGCLTCGTCSFGYVLDATGCPTCTCNSPPSVCPGMKCAACPPGYENVRDAYGCLTCNCAPVLSCSQLSDATSCAARGDCAWLEPGYCPSPPPVREGCYDRAAVNCITDKDCSDGRTCVEVGTKPCTVGCDICGYTLYICL